MTGMNPGQDDETPGAVLNHGGSERDNMSRKIQGRRNRTRANGEGGITAIRDSKGRITGYKASLTIGYGQEGRQLRKWFRGKNREEVQKKLSNAQYEKNQGFFLTAEDPTLADYLHSWIDVRATHDLAELTVRHYRSLLKNHISPKLGEKRLTRLGAQDLDGLYRQMLQKGLSPRMAQMAHVMLHCALKQALKWGKVVRNVAEAATPPKVPPTRADAWTREEAVRFLDAIRQDDLYPLFFLAIMTGLRRGELLGLHWEDIDFPRRELHVRHNLIPAPGGPKLTKPKTEASQRSILLAPDSIEVLREHEALQQARRTAMGEQWQEQGLVFPSNVGTPYQPRNLQRSFDRLVRKAEVRRIRLHDLRHTSASLSILKGSSPKEVADRMGHRDPHFTNRVYVHLFPEQRQTAVLSLVDLLPEDE